MWRQGLGVSGEPALRTLDTADQGQAECRGNQHLPCRFLAPAAHIVPWLLHRQRAAPWHHRTISPMIGIRWEKWRKAAGWVPYSLFLVLTSEVTSTLIQTSEMYPCWPLGMMLLVEFPCPPEVIRKVAHAWSVKALCHVSAVQPSRKISDLKRRWVSIQCHSESQTLRIVEFYWMLVLWLQDVAPSMPWGCPFFGLLLHPTLFKLYLKVLLSFSDGLYCAQCSVAKSVSIVLLLYRPPWGRWHHTLTTPHLDDTTPWRHHTDDLHSSCNVHVSVSETIESG